MYVKCESKGLRIEGEWVAKGSVKKVAPETSELLKPLVVSGVVTLHSKNPVVRAASKAASARKSKKAPGLEAIEKESEGQKAE